MIYNWTSVLLFTPLLVVIFWIIWRDSEYEQLLKDPKNTWSKKRWKETLIISIIIASFLFLVLPFLRSMIIEFFAPLTSNPENTSQVQMTRKSVGVFGSILGISISAVLSGVIGFGEELIFRGIFLHYFQKKTHFAVALTSSAFLFAYSHMIETGFAFGFFVYAFLNGLIFGLMWKKYGLLGSGVVHGLLNVFGTLIILF